MGKFVRIQSTRSIVVTGGLQTIDATNLASQNADRLNVRPMWNNIKVRIQAGTGYYPAYITKWNTVKVLSAKEVLTIGEETDSVPEKYAETAEKIYNDLTKACKAYNREIEKQETLKAGNKKNTKKKPSALEFEEQKNILNLEEETEE